MAGTWAITTRSDGSRVTTYYDHRTRKRWTCGRTPAQISERDVFAWVLAQATYADVIVTDGRPWFVCTPSLD